MAQGVTVNLLIPDTVRQRVQDTIALLQAAGLTEGQIGQTVGRSLRVVPEDKITYRLEFYGEVG